MPPSGAATDGLVLRFLGGCGIAVGGAPVRLESAKTAALLAYVAVAGGTHSRPKLAGIFWPELAEVRASAALRRALWDQRRRLAASGGDAPLRVTRGTVAFDAGAGCDLDVERFRRLLAGHGPIAGRFAGEAGLERLEQAVMLYRGDLLDGFFVDGAPAFEEWLLAERERLRMAAIQALQLLVVRLRDAGETVRALGHARRLLAIDPWLEEAHRAVGELLARSGQVGAALQQLQACRRVLAEELGAAPSVETQELERRLRAQARPVSGGADGGAAGDGPAAAAPRQNLPLPTTPFVGRERELAAVAERLADPDCRLLTVLGPGGIGKTRLALQAAFQALGGGEQPRVPFPDGIVFVASSESQPAGVLAEQIARAFDLAPGGSSDLPTQVCAFLGAKRALLLLDGFEHRLGDAGLLSAILAAAPEVKLLVTSRERLRLDGEWVLELGGLDLPSRDGARESSRSPAVQLYLRAARRATLDFRAEGATLAAISAICRLVAGMPLAIEMAAAWTASLTPAQLAAELGGGLDLLASPLRHAPADQGSLRAVFEHSFARLSGEEQRALCALTVVTGGISTAAAAAIAGAGPLRLRALSDRSFLRLDPESGRYAIHEVLRYCAGAKLAESPDEERGCRDRHAGFFAALLRSLEEQVRVQCDRAALDAVAADIDNLRLAWGFAVTQCDLARLAGMLPALAAFHEAVGWYREGERLIDEAITALRGARGADGAARDALADALLARASLRNRLGGYAAAVEDAESALGLLAAVAGGARRAPALLVLGESALLRGRFGEAREHLSEAAAAARACGAKRVLADALGRLGRVVLDQGRHGEASALFEESLAVAREIGNHHAEAYAVNQLGFVAYFDGDLDRAEARLDEALRLAEAAGDRGAAALALQGRGFVAEDRGELERAASLYREGLALCEEHGDRFGAGRNLMLLGEVARKRRRFDEARAHYARSLEINRAIGSRYICGLLHGNLALVASAERDLPEARREVRAALIEYRATGSHTVAIEPLVSLAEVAHAAGDTPRALALLGLAGAHPANRQDHRLEVERVVAAIRAERPDLDVDAGLRAGRDLALDDVVAAVLAESEA